MSLRKADAVVGVSLILFLCIIGCAASDRICGDLCGADTILRKKIAVLPFADLAGHEEDGLGAIAAEQFRKVLTQDCKGLVVEDNKRGLHIEAVVKSSAGIDSMDVTRVARALGLNAILTGGLFDIRICEQKEGIWPFRKTVPGVSFELEARLYDVETKAVLLDERAKFSTKIEEDVSERGKQDFDLQVVTGLLREAVRELSRKVCTAMEEEPWKGYVISFEDNRVEISAGADTGLHKGDVLEVFGWEPPLEGREGRLYLISGPGIGEIQVEEVFQHTSVAAVISGDDFEKSNCVKVLSESK